MLVASLRSRIALLLLVVVCPGSGGAQTPWPEDVKARNGARCNAQMVARGLSKESAPRYCACLVNAMAQQLGFEEYDAIAGLKPKGPELDRKLKSIMAECIERTDPQLAR